MVYVTTSGKSPCCVPVVSILVLGTYRSAHFVFLLSDTHSAVHGSLSPNELMI